MFEFGRSPDLRTTFDLPVCAELISVFTVVFEEKSSHLIRTDVQKTSVPIQHSLQLREQFQTLTGFPFILSPLKGIKTKNQGKNKHSV